MKTKTEKSVLTDKENLNEVVECLRENIPISSKKTESEKDLYNIIIGAAASADSIENTSNKLDKPYTGRTVRNYLVNNFQDFQELEAQINKTLKSKLPRGIRKRKHKLAIDINLIPYFRPSK